MTYLDRLIVKEMKEDIEDAVFSDENGEFIDSLAGLQTDSDIVNDESFIGGYEDDECL